MIGAIIPAYNGGSMLGECIDSLCRQTRRLDRIYVVDNASGDGTCGLIRNNYRDRVTYIRLDENTGPTGGFAIGMELAVRDGCDWVWLMDQDAQAEPDCLENLLVGAADETIVAAAPTKHDSNGTLWVGEILNGVGVPLTYYLDPIFDIDTTMWSGLLVRARAIHQVGLPLVQLFGWWCDAEYCFRLKRLGRLVVVPRSAIRHHPTGAVHLDFSGYWKHYYYLRNSMYLYLRGYLPGPGLWRLSLNIVRQIGYITLKQDHKSKRLHILLTAVIHALSGRMGRGPAWLH